MAVSQNWTGRMTDGHTYGMLTSAADLLTEPYNDNLSQVQSTWQLDEVTAMGRVRLMGSTDVTHR